MVFGKRLLETARQRGAHPAIEDGARVVTYEALARDATVLAARLQDAGVRAGDVVAVAMTDSTDHILLLVALAQVGAVIHSLSPTLPRPELQRALAERGVTLLVLDEQKRPGTNVPSTTVEALMKRPEGPYRAPDLSRDAPLLLIQSSGTTGRPKAHLRSHAQFDEWMRRYAETQAWSPSDRYFCQTSLSFNIGRSLCLGLLVTGATLVVRQSDSAKETVEEIRDAGITYLNLAPSDVLAFLSVDIGREPLFPKLRAMVTGSAPLARRHRDLARRRLTANFCEQLGTNEGGLMAFASPSDLDAQPDTLGRIAKGLEAQIVDAHGTVLPPGVVGEIRYRGPGIATAYLDDAAASARAFRDGWFYPGDLASLDEEGFLFFKGRADDVINNEGAKFYPSEVEAVLAEHPACADVAVVGVAHPQHGEVAAAVVVTARSVSEAELIALCRGRLAGHKVPAFLALADALPRTAAGKVDRKRLRALLVHRLSAGR